VFTFRINVTRNIVVPQFIRPGQLRMVGQTVAIPTMLLRIGQGLDVADSPARSLSSPYVMAKSRRGHSGIPDLRYSGALLADLSVLSTQDMKLLIGFRSPLSVIKAIANQARRHQIGLSPADQAVVAAAIRDMVGQNLAEVRRTSYRAA